VSLLISVHILKAFSDFTISLSISLSLVIVPALVSCAELLSYGGLGDSAVC